MFVKSQLQIIDAQEENHPLPLRITTCSMKNKSSMIDQVLPLNANDQIERNTDYSSFRQSFDQNLKSPTLQRWKKVTKVIKSINCLKSHEIKPINNAKDFDSDLQDYQTRLFSNTKKNTDEDLPSKKSSLNQEPGLKQTIIDAMTAININNNKKNRDKMKKDVYDLIIEGDDDSIKSIENIIQYNPDRNEKSPSDPYSLFNTCLDNGQNLFYIACKEGKQKIVELFLKLGLNARIQSKIENDIWENPLECACRWNYLKLVTLLLEKGNFTIMEINKAMRLNNLSKSIKALLKDKMKKVNNETKVYCFC